MINQLQALNDDGKDLRITKNIYWEQTAAIGNENELGQLVKIRWGMRQGCILSPDLFSLYSEQMHEIEGLPGFGVGLDSSLKYANEIVLIATSKKDLQNTISETDSDHDHI